MKAHPWIINLGPTRVSFISLWISLEHTFMGIRSVLKEVNWARAGLGMPLLPSTLPKPQHLFSSPSSPPISSNFDTGMVYNKIKFF